MVKKLIALILTFLISSQFTLISTFAHYDSAYSHDEIQVADNKNWMKNIGGSNKLGQLSIPGTHDSMAHKSNLSFIDTTRTQTMNLTQQLNSGIRYLDIRVKYTPNGFPLHHGIVYLGYDFEDVLKEVTSFLQKNPSESVIMRFKQEESSASDEDMKKVFDKYYEQYKQFFYTGKDYNPTLNEIRGKIVLFSDVISLYTYGIPYRDIDKQDNYYLKTNWDLYDKWEKVKSFANKQNNERDKNDLSINYLTGNGGAMPYFIASGHSDPSTGAPRLATGLTEPGFSNYYPDFPRVNWFLWFATIAFEGINTLYADYITNQDIKYTGIVAADFPGKRLIEAIISKNDNLSRSSYNEYTNFNPNDYEENIINPNNVLDSGKIIIKLKNSNNVLELNNNNPNKLSLNTKNGLSNQSWIVRYNEKWNAYQIHSAQDESIVLSYNPNNSSIYTTKNMQGVAQFWKIENNNGYAIFINESTNNKVITADNNQNNSNLFLDINTKKELQSFELIQVK